MRWRVRFGKCQGGKGWGRGRARPDKSWFGDRSVFTLSLPFRLCHSPFCCLFLCPFHSLSPTLMPPFPLCLSSPAFSLCGGLCCLAILSPAVFISFQRQILYSLFTRVSYVFGLTMTSAEAEEDMLLSRELHEWRQHRREGARERVLHVFSWGALWLVCGQPTCGSRPFRVMCFSSSMFDYYHRGFIRLCQQCDIQPCAAFITSTSEEVLFSLRLLPDKWRE